MVKSILLQDGNEIFIDDEDYERVNQYTWRSSPSDNVFVAIVDSELITIKRFLFGDEKITQIIKGNDYTKNNMIKESPKKHMRAWSQSKSKYKGVSWHGRSKYWVATIHVDGKNKWLGGYATEEEAAEVYNKAVDDYWGGEGLKNVIGKSSATDSISSINDSAKKRLPRRRPNKVGYRGVSETRNGKFQVRINYRTKQVTLVYGESNKERAALIYNKTVVFLHGEDAILNDVPMTGELKEFISNWEIPEKIKKLKED